MLSNYRVYRYDHMESLAVTAGTRAVLIGAQNGLFPDIGHNVPGEMGGLWAGEKKVCDGFFFAIDDVPLRIPWRRHFITECRSRACISCAASIFRTASRAA